MKFNSKILISRKQGQIVVETLVALGVFTLGVVSVWLLVISIYDSSRLGKERSRGRMLAEEGIEAVRSIRDRGFTNLSPGVYGLSLVGRRWGLVGAPDTTGPFLRTVTITSVGANRFNISVSVQWQFTTTRPERIAAETRLTRWR